MTWLNRFFLWLGYIRADTPRPYTRTQNGTDAIARGQRWQAFAEEDGGLYDMIHSLRADYFAKYSQLSPDDRGKQLALSVADKIAQEFSAKVSTIIETGKMRAKDKEHVDRVANVGRYVGR